ncbi:hypothetical protein CDL15_Pgr022353 [Punica granatum]|uniref:Uncharacterized protein n=1 Tax=Punica granatum TaxID=22663 RepID=A0A218Y325_PUNGR|nr:hypothetical protein CDL15_Pgr022353 [Punica granatum]
MDTRVVDRTSNRWVPSDYVGKSSTIIVRVTRASFGGGRGEVTIKDTRNLDQDGGSGHGLDPSQDRSSWRYEGD